MCKYALYFVNIEYLIHFAVMQPLGQVKYKTHWMCCWFPQCERLNTSSWQQLPTVMENTYNSHLKRKKKSPMENCLHVAKTARYLT